jgi:sugar lactone lactonase YvrE
MQRITVDRIIPPSTPGHRHRLTPPRPRASARAGLSLLAAAALLFGTLAAVLLTGSGGSGAATPSLTTTTTTAVNTLYVLNSGPTTPSIASFAPGATGNVAPTSSLSGMASQKRHMAMDLSGNVWVVNASTNRVVEFTQAQLATGGSQTPTVTLNAAAGSLSTPSALAFDRSGDLWVANQGSSVAANIGSLVEFTPSQLAASGAPVPAVTITSNGSGGVDIPSALAFDGRGDLWMGNSFDNAVVDFTPAQLSASGTPTPAVTLTATAGSINAPDGLVFDSSGRLWVANDPVVPPGSLVAFSSTQLASSGAPVPQVTLGSNTAHTNIDGPSALTFDPFGNLWVSNNGAVGGSITEFSPAQLAASGTPTPVSTLTGLLTTLDAPSGVLFVPSTGYTLAATDGGVFNYGGSGFFGSTGNLTLNSPIVGMAGSPDGLGYWLVAGDGGIFNFGDSGFYGSHGGSPLNKPVVGMAATPDGKGYWLVASDGGIFSYGDATFYGSHGGSPLNQPIVGMAATPDGKGYWLVASDGGIFSYGDATFVGSHGGSPLNKPVVGMAATSDGGGYWLVASDGGIFNYGDAAFNGSAGSVPLNKPIVGMAATPNGGGYWLVASDGGIFNYGNALFFGSHGGSPLNKPIVAMAGPYS